MELLSIENWVCLTKLTPHSEISNYVIFHRNKQLPFTHSPVSARCISLKRQESTSFLGIYLDFQLRQSDVSQKQELDTKASNIPL